MGGIIKPKNKAAFRQELLPLSMTLSFPKNMNKHE